MRLWRSSAVSAVTIVSALTVLTGQAAAQDRGRSNAPISEPSLQALAGDYQAQTQIVQVRLRADGILTFGVPPQPVQELQPLGNVRFAQKGLPGYSVEFVRDPAGSVVGLISHQPKGDFFAARVRAPQRTASSGRGPAPTAAPVPTTSPTVTAPAPAAPRVGAPASPAPAAAPVAGTQIPTTSGGMPPSAAARPSPSTTAAAPATPAARQPTPSGSILPESEDTPFLRIGAVDVDAADFVVALDRQNREGQDFNRDIAQAREAFWAQYPSGRGRLAAETRFAELLMLKDVLVAIPYATSPAGGCENRTTSVFAHVLGTRQIDGGIPIDAWILFCDWIDQARSQLRAAMTSARIEAVFSLPEYSSYREQRDYIEFVRAGQSPITPELLARSTDPYIRALQYLWGLNEYGQNVMDHPQYRTFPARYLKARLVFQSLEKKIGRERLLSITKQLMDAPKVPFVPPGAPPGTVGRMDLAEIPPGCSDRIVEWCFQELVGLRKQR